MLYNQYTIFLSLCCVPETESEAIKSSKQYYRRLAKWDGLSTAEASRRIVNMFGYDLSQSQYFVDIEAEESEEES